MSATETLSIILLIFALIFILISIAASLVFLNILLSIKRILSKAESFLDNVRENQEEVKIKILDFTESTLLKIRNLLDDKINPKKGGDNYAKRKKEK